MVIINCIILIVVFVQDNMMQLVWLTVSFTFNLDHWHCVMYVSLCMAGVGE